MIDFILRKNTDCHTALMKDEDGFVLVMVLMMMVAMTIIGIAATNTTTMELQIAGNDKSNKINFYTSEAAALEGAQKLVNETSEQVILPSRNPSPSDSDLVRSASAPVTASNLEADKLNLDTNNDGVVDHNDNFASSTLQPANINVAEVVALTGVQSGSSLGMDTSRLYDYISYGLADTARGRVIIKVGIKKRF